MRGFFLRSISEMDAKFSGLFESGDDGEGDDGGTSRGSVSGFMDYYGWHYQATLVAEYERVKLADVWELSAINFLNDLAYLKAKNEHERLMYEQNKRNG